MNLDITDSSQGITIIKNIIADNGVYIKDVVFKDHYAFTTSTNDSILVYDLSTSVHNQSINYIKEMQIESTSINSIYLNDDYLYVGIDKFSDPTGFYIRRKFILCRMFYYSSSDWITINIKHYPH